MPSSSHDDVRKFMEQRRRGASTGGRELRFDPATKKFVVVEAGSRTADDLPIVTREDLQAFGGMRAA